MLIITIVIIIISIFVSKYFDLKQKKIEILEFNAQYEKYLDREITGNSITTIINKAIDDRKKDENKAVNIEIKTIDIDRIFTMDVLYGGGIEQFARLYNDILFKSIQYEYNEENRIYYILFEQITS
jgi:hypothetical protein